MTEHQNSSDHQSAGENYLSGLRIEPRSIYPDMTVAELFDQQLQAYNAARLQEAARIFVEEMLAPEKNVTIGLTMAGALTPAGLGGCILTLMKYGFVDFIVSTGANLYHDIHHALAMSLHRGDFRLDDTQLVKENIIRIYDILFKSDVLIDTDAFVYSCLQTLPNRSVSTAELHYHLGTTLLAVGVKPECSILAHAAALQIPIYTSSPGDSSIGMNLAKNALDGSSLTLDPLADVNEMTATVHHADLNGVMILGGGSPKNFYLQTHAQLWEVLGLQKGAVDYFVQITTDAPHWGGLSGATPSEAVSWGKIKAEQLRSTVVVYADTTIALPLITAYAVSKAQPRPQKKLFTKRGEMLNELKDAYNLAKKSRL